MIDKTDKWSSENFSLVPLESVCANCVHYKTAGDCDAFNVIPESILYGGVKHDAPLRGQDNDIVFEARQKK